MDRAWLDGLKPEDVVAVQDRRRVMRGVVARRTATQILVRVHDVVRRFRATTGEEVGGWETVLAPWTPKVAAEVRRVAICRLLGTIVWSEQSDAVVEAVYTAYKSAGGGQ